MIDIVKHGKYAKMQEKCARCGCEFTFNLDDAGWDKYKQQYVIDCPECGENIEVGLLDRYDWYNDD